MSYIYESGVVQILNGTYKKDDKPVTLNPKWVATDMRTKVFPINVSTATLVASDQLIICPISLPISLLALNYVLSSENTGPIEQTTFACNITICMKYNNVYIDLLSQPIFRTSDRTKFDAIYGINLINLIDEWVEENKSTLNEEGLYDFYQEHKFSEVFYLRLEVEIADNAVDYIMFSLNYVENLPTGMSDIELSEIKALDIEDK